MFCKFCGAVNPDEANFCGNCSKQLRKTLLPYRRKKGRGAMKIIIVLVFFLTLGTYLSYLVFEDDTFAYIKRPEPLREKIDAIKNAGSQSEPDKERVITFYLRVTPEEIDGYLNEELFKKTNTGFRTIRTRLLDKEIEVALATDFLRIPSMFRVRIRPEKSKGELTISTSSIRLGSLPIPHSLYPAIYRRYPWLNIEHLMKLSGVKLEDIRIGSNFIIFRGVWST